MDKEIQSSIKSIASQISDVHDEIEKAIEAGNENKDMHLSLFALYKMENTMSALLKYLQ